VVNISDSLSTVQATVVTAESSCGLYSASLAGATVMQFTNGTAQFASMMVSCYPMGNLTIMFTGHLGGLSTAYDLTTKVHFTFRDCVDGEVLRGSSCQLCPNGSYSFFYSADAKCLPCPLHSTGCYGSKISIAAGYWRLSAYSTTFLECPFGSHGCLGGVNRYGLTTATATTPLVSSLSTTATRASARSASTVSTCALGYEGPLCGVCSTGYYLKASQNICVACKSESSILQLVTLIVVPLIMIGIAAYIVFNCWWEDDSDDAVAAKRKKEMERLKRREEKKKEREEKKRRQSDEMSVTSNRGGDGASKADDDSKDDDASILETARDSTTVPSSKERRVSNMSTVSTGSAGGTGSEKRVSFAFGQVADAVAVAKNLVKMGVEEVKRRAVEKEKNSFSTKLKILISVFQV
jgi:hypothetical protein